MTSSSRPLSAPAPATVRLAPGLRVVRRGRDRLQVGLDPGRRLVLPRRPGTEALLRALATDEEATAAPAQQPVVDALATHDLLAAVDAGPVPRVEVRTTPATATWPVELDPLVDPPGPLPGPAAPRLRLVRSRPDCVLVLAVGEPDRTELDPLVRDGVPHLVLALVDGGARLGPFVVPGRTACLRCVDAHLAADDPDHLAVLTRYAAATREVRPDDVDPVLAGLVTAWALRDLALLLGPDTGHHGGAAGAVPATWSTTLTWHPSSPSPETRPWLRHPGCGCGWASYDETTG